PHAKRSTLPVHFTFGFADPWYTEGRFLIPDLELSLRFTVALPSCHRSSLEGLMGRELVKALVWVDSAPAEVVIGLEGEGNLATCAEWPGEAGALALLEAGFHRLRDRLHMERLNNVGRALASEQDLDKLLDLILVQAQQLVSAEAGSIYLVVGEGEGRELLFAHTQNSRLSIPYHRFRMPLSTSSMAGFVATTGESLNINDVYRIPTDAPYHFNDSFDIRAGYRTVSMLCVPLQDTDGEVLGVLQLINRMDEDEEGRTVVPFLAEQVHLAESLAGQAGVAVRNAGLRRDIENLFESFVNASVLAIEQRDPVTSGHSGRVASLTVGLAEAISQTPNGPYAGVFFSDRQIREIRYASLLHDFGKVGVREQVLVKAKKLEPTRLEMVLQRIRQRQEERMRLQLLQDWEAGRPYDAARWQSLMVEFEADANHLIALVVQANEPSVLPKEVMGDLERLGGLTFTHWNGQTDGVVTETDLAALRIPKGSLSDEERSEIESHVTHTFQFLKQIPWTKDLASVPEIAFAHHERLNAKGYPRQLGDGDIPVQSKAMAIADIFDALTAQDRPYKAAVPLERSLGILESDAKSGHLDPELLRLFIEAKVYERTAQA
ncbi:MAG: GAF domain-containing protein, partial [Holophaga sp.]|nr:GAF domain-containing protein [Holophaga sp.]